MPNLLAEQTMADVGTVAFPFDYLARLRREDPVHYDAGLGAWLVTKYEDIRKAAAMTGEFSIELGHGARPEWMDAVDEYMTREGFGPHLARDNFGLDGIQHAKRRALVQKALTPGVVAKLEPVLTEIVANRIEESLPRSADQVVDVVKELAVTIPALTLCEILGLPFDCLDIITTGMDSVMALVGNAATQSNALEHADRVIALQRFVTERINERRQNPGTDMISRLTMAAVDEDGNVQLTDNELLSMALVVIAGGTETTRNAISWALYTLATRPDLLKRLQSAADQRKQVQRFVDEVLRFYGPVQSIPRGTTSEIVLRDRIIPKGAMVFLFGVSGNRDSSQFANPDVFDMDRENLGGHLTFGSGPHFCLGAMLARLEMVCVVRELIKRIDAMSLVVPEDQLDMAGTMVILRGPHALPVTFDVLPGRDTEAAYA